MLSLAALLAGVVALAIIVAQAAISAGERRAFDAALAADRDVVVQPTAAVLPSDANILRFSLARAHARHGAGIIWMWANDAAGANGRWNATASLPEVGARTAMRIDARSLVELTGISMGHRALDECVVVEAAAPDVARGILTRPASATALLELFTAHRAAFVNVDADGNAVCSLARDALTVAEAKERFAAVLKLFEALSDDAHAPALDAGAQVDAAVGPSSGVPFGISLLGEDPHRRGDD